MALTISVPTDIRQARPAASTRHAAVHRDRTRRLFAELAGIDLLWGNGERGSRRRRTGRDRALLQYAVLNARPAA